MCSITQFIKNGESDARVNTSPATRIGHLWVSAKEWSSLSCRSWAISQSFSELLATGGFKEKWTSAIHKATTSDSLGPRTGDRTLSSSRPKRILLGLLLSFLDITSPYHNLSRCSAHVVY